MQQYGNDQILYSPSDLGAFSYEVLDTKLARTAEPKHILSLAAIAISAHGEMAAKPSGSKMTV